MFHMFSNSIDYEIIGQDGMSFKKSFKILFKESITIMLRPNMIWQNEYTSCYNI
jgi:hypothetical protein